MTQPARAKSEPHRPSVRGPTVQDTVKRLRKYIDSIDFFYGIFPFAAGYAAFVTWTPLVVRAIRGEEVKEGWRLYTATAASMAAYTLKSGAQIRQAEALRAAVANLREVQREAAEDAKQRDERAAAQQDRLNRLTQRLVVIAAVTLAASIVTLVVAIVGV
jgi:hypothetical protein